MRLLTFERLEVIINHNPLSELAHVRPAQGVAQLGLPVPRPETTIDTVLAHTRDVVVLEDERVVESYLGTTEEAVNRSGGIR